MTASAIAKGALFCAGASTATAVLAFELVDSTGSAAPLRGWFAFGFAAPSGELSEAAGIALDNLRLAAVPLAGAWAVPRVPRLRLVVDLAVAVLVLVNSALVGAAVGAYGLGLVSILVPHALFELAAFSVAGGTYLAARRTTTAPAVAALLAAVLLVIAAGIEAGVRAR